MINHLLCLVILNLSYTFNIAFKMKFKLQSVYTISMSPCLEMKAIKTLVMVELCVCNGI